MLKTTFLAVGILTAVPAAAEYKLLAESSLMIGSLSYPSIVVDDRNCMAGGDITILKIDEAVFTGADKCGLKITDKLYFPAHKVTLKDEDPLFNEVQNHVTAAIENAEKKGDLEWAKKLKEDNMKWLKSHLEYWRVSEGEVGQLRKQ